MMTQIARILTTDPAAILEDAIGVVAIFVIILVGLSLPGLA